MRWWQSCSGDGNLTTLTLLPGGTELPRVTQFFYDWRNRLRASENDVLNVDRRLVMATEGE